MQKIILTTLFILFLSGNIQAQKNEENRSDTILFAAREIIASTKYCAFITVDSTGEAHARMMVVNLPEKDFSIWFGTNVKSRKLREIKNNPNVTVYYADHGGNGYITLYGEAFLINSPDEIQKHWKKDWENYFTDKKDFILIKIAPIKLEIISYKHKLNGNKKTWRAVNYQF